MSKTSFTDKIIKTSSAPIHLIRCKDEMGRDCHYFLMCPASKLKTLRETKTGIIDFKDYGIIIASGFGSEVPQATRDMLKEKYNFESDCLK